MRISMVFKREDNLKGIHKKTMDLHEKQINNAQLTSKHHQLEQTLHEMNVKEKNVMNRLFESWKRIGIFLCN